MMICDSYLEKKTYRWLLTGCAGFIGSNILEYLLRENQIVVGVDNFCTGFSENLENIRRSIGNDKWRNFTFIEGDIRNENLCKRIIYGIDFTLHQAALGSVPRSLKYPIEVNSVNVSGFLNILKMSLDCKVKKFIFASSSSVYGDCNSKVKSEDQKGRLLSPYAASKEVNEIYADYFSRYSGISVLGLRYFNVFGKYQNPHGEYAAVIPRWVNAMLNFENVIIYGDGSTSRDFCYVRKCNTGQHSCSNIQHPGISCY